MGLINRLRRITYARIEAFLDTVDDPESVLPRLTRELNDNVRAAINAEAKALTAIKAANRRLDEARGRVMRLAKGAELALSRGDDKTAREAIAAQVAAERDAENHQEAAGRSELALKQARETRVRLESDLAELKSRRNEIISRARDAGMRKKSRQTLARIGCSGEGILDQISKMESRLDEDEAELEISVHGRDISLEERLSLLARDAEIESRLARMRKQSQ